MAIAGFVCVVAPVLLVGLQITANPKFSPLDELAHLDYMERVSRGEVPRQGDRLLDSSLRELRCRGQQLGKVELPTCEKNVARYDKSSTWYQHEAQQPPTYYVLTVPMRWLAHNVLGFTEDLRATRITSIAWLVLGMMLLWAAGRVMAIAPLPLGASLLLLVTAPSIIYTSGMVSNDATAVPAAGLVALVAALAYRRPGRQWTAALFATGFAVAACKVTNVLPAIAVSALFAVVSMQHRALGWSVAARSWLRNGGALLLGGLSAALIWMIVHRSIAHVDIVDDPTFDAARQGPRTFGVVLSSATSLLSPSPLDQGDFLRGLSSETIGHDVQVPFYKVLAFAPIAAGLSGLFVSPRRWPHVLGVIAIAVLCLAGLGLGIGLLVVDDIDPTPSYRYGFSLVTLLMLVLAASLSGKWAQRGVATFAAALFLTTLTVMVT